MKSDWGWSDGRVGSGGSGAARLNERVPQAELEAAKKFLYQEMGYRSRSEQLTKTSEINLDYQEVIR